MTSTQFGASSIFDFSFINGDLNDNTVAKPLCPVSMFHITHQPTVTGESSTCIKCSPSQEGDQDVKTKLIGSSLGVLNLNV